MLILDFSLKIPDSLYKKGCVLLRRDSGRFFESEDPHPSFKNDTSDTIFRVLRISEARIYIYYLSKSYKLS